MASQSKTQLLNSIHANLKRRYKVEPRGERMPVLEAVVFGICHEGTTREQANQALSRFKDQFYDWNEVRVSSLPEIEGVLAGLPDRGSRALAIRRFLRQLFESTYGFTLESLLKHPLKDAIKALREYEAGRSEYVLATVVQRALGGHAIPLDAPLRRALVRLGVIEPDTDDATVRSLLERAIPKNRGLEFCDLMEELCYDTCLEESPLCGRCELRKQCPHGQARLAAQREAARAKARKPARPAKAVKPLSRDGVARAVKPKAAKKKPAAPVSRTKPPKTRRPR
jgi:endonuclease-3